MIPNEMDRTCRQLRTSGTGFHARDDGGPIIEGYFSVFNSDYELWPGAAEQVDPGAFDNTLGDDVRALINHDTRLVLGRTKAGTLTLRVDEKGLFGTIKINDQDSDAMNLYARVQRGDVDQASFGFAWAEDGVVWEQLPDGRARRNVLRIVKLWEISVCTFPAYEQTYVAARDRVAAEAEAQARRARKESMKRRFRHHA